MYSYAAYIAFLYSLILCNDHVVPISHELKLTTYEIFLIYLYPSDVRLYINPNYRYPPVKKTYRHRTWPLIVDLPIQHEDFP